MDGLTEERAYPPATQAWFATTVLAIATVLAYLDRQIITLLIEPIRKDLLLSDTQISLIQGMAFAIFFVLAGLPIGRLVDRMNRRNLLVVGVLLWSIMTALSGLANSFWGLFVARMGVGVGEACLAPAASSMIVDYFRPSGRGKPLGVMAAGASAGGALSMLLVGALLGLLGSVPFVAVPLIGQVAPWQVAFLAAGAPGLLVAALLYTVREPVRREKVANGEDAGFLAYLREHRPAFTYTYLVFAGSFVMSYAVALWAPVILLRIHRLPPAEVGFIIGTALLVCGMVGCVIAGAVSDWMKRRFPLDGRFRMLFFTLPGQIAFVLLFLIPDSVTIAVIAYTGTMFFVSLTVGTGYVTLYELVPNEMRGQALAVYMLIANLAGLGLAPTAVALTTDYIFKDEMMVHYSIVTVTVPTVSLALLLALCGRAAYARTSSARLERTHAFVPTEQIRHGASASLEAEQPC